jgi:hypothetical protein
MGYHSLIENVVLPQVVASLGGLAFTLQLPPPDSPAPPSSHQIAILLLALLLFLAFVWLLLPKKWTRKLIEAFWKHRQ